MDDGPLIIRAAWPRYSDDAEAATTELYVILTLYKLAPEWCAAQAAVAGDQ